ncbi:MAG: M56 family metallopeptidase, partial [Planctomycetes bacterium]|nr:M56 family metallopeptidase [Planctomycetota bacterium]
MSNLLATPENRGNEMGITISQYMASASDFAVPFLLDVLIKVTVLIAAACLAIRLTRTASAAVRHRIWSTTFACLLLLPGLSLLLPGLRLRIVPAPEAVITGTAQEFTSVASESVEPEVDGVSLEWLFAAKAGEETTAEPPPLPVDLRVPGMESTDVPASSAFNQSAWSLPRRSLAFAVWLIGLAITLVPITIGLACNRVLARTAVPIVDSERHRLFSQLRQRLGLKRNTRLLETDKWLVPMTWGILQPIVLVPRVWREWPVERQRIVLLHELAHVKRWDAAYQLAARLASAVYWFHPLVWYALRQLRAEREMACDDCVLMAGERPTNYAAHLLNIVRDCRSMAMVAVVAMVQPGRLERRVRAILDKTRSRLPIGPAAGVAVLVCATILLIGVAMAGPNRS